MMVTDEALELIRRHEGLRTTAYRDAAGVWTIGYGHTSLAGPPRVRPGMTVTEAEAEAILRRDAAMFAAAIRPLIKVELSEAQFAALVSFAYNVGSAAFARSSVLAAVNAGNFDAVPRRLGLWVKAGGRTLPGLIRRRSEEAALFTGRSGPDGGRPAAPRPQPPCGKPALRSTTNLAALLSAIAGLFSAVAAAVRDLAVELGGGWVLWAAVAVIVLATAWIVRERYLKSVLDGV